MTWPDESLVPSTSTLVANLGFTGAAQTFEVTSGMVPGALTVWVRGGRGATPDEYRFNLRNTTAIALLTPTDVGTWSVVVGGDGSGHYGGYPNGGNGGAGVGTGYTYGGGGGGATRIYDPTGTLRAWAGGTGGASGGIVDGLVLLSVDADGLAISPVQASVSYTLDAWAIGAPGLVQGQGGNMAPDRDPTGDNGGTGNGYGNAEHRDGWNVVTGIGAPGGDFGGSGNSESGGDGGTVPGGMEGPGGGGGGGGGLYGGGGGGAGNFAADDPPYIGGGHTVAAWALGPGAHGDGDMDWSDIFLSLPFGRGGAAVAAGIPWVVQQADLGVPLSEPNGAALIAYNSYPTGRRRYIGKTGFGRNP